MFVTQPGENSSRRNQRSPLDRPIFPPFPVPRSYVSRTNDIAVRRTKERKESFRSKGKGNGSFRSVRWNHKDSPIDLSATASRAVATDLRVVLDSTEQGTCFRSLSLRASLPSSLRPVRARTKQVNRKVTSSLIDYTRIYTRIWCVKKGGEDDLPLGRRHWIKRRTKGGEAVRERERDRSQRGRRERDRERKNGAIRDECAHGNTCTDGIERDG